MKRSFHEVAIFLLFALSSSFAAEPTYDVTIAAGEQDRSQVPVRISIPPVALRAKPNSVILAVPNGKAIPAQLTKPGLLAPRDSWGEIHFIVPHLKAGETLALQA